MNIDDVKLLRDYGSCKYKHYAENYLINTEYSGGYIIPNEFQYLKFSRI